MKFGTVPLSWFEPRSRCTSSGIAKIDSGTGPDSEFKDNDNSWRDNKSPIELGIVPVIPFEERFKICKFSSRVKEVGIFPKRLLCDKSM